MTETTEETPASEDVPGAWYLELLGIDPAAVGSQPEPARSRSNEVTFTLEAPSGSTSIPTPLEAPRPTRAVPGDRGALDEPGEEELADWTPEALAKQVRSRRNFRWTVVAALVVVVVGFVAAVLFLPIIVENSANDEVDDYQAVLASLRETLPETQQALATATDPLTSASSLFSLAADMTRVEAASRAVVTRANRALPDSPPLLPRSALEDLIPSRERMLVLGADGMAIHDRLSAAIAYRITIDAILLYPSLPVRADPSQINGLSVALAETLADSAAILADLPLEPSFESHRVSAEAAVQTFGDWQIEYLDALRNNDAGTTAALIAQAQQARIDLFDDIFPALAATRSDIDAQIIALDAAILDTARKIPRP
jgi:hypothetical protein